MGWVGIAMAEEVVVEADTPEATASERQLDRGDIVALPGRSTDELLRSMPGLHASAHGGTGKAYQLFVRGFDAVHGADVAVTVEGVPLNEPSNVHGQGYLDLHLLPRVLVDRATLRPGAFRPADGDFAVAGAADFGLGLDTPGLWTSAGQGTDRTVSAELAWRPARRGPGSFAVATMDGGHGVGEARDFTQLRGAAGLDGQVGGWALRAFVLGYRGRFDSPGVLRLDDLEAGRSGFYDAYPGSGGGASDRLLGAVTAEGGRGDRHGRAQLWGGWRDLVLDQNFTGWANDPVHGDATRQTHTDRSGGLSIQGGFDPVPLGVVGGLDLAIHDMDQTEGGLQGDQVWEARVDAGPRQRSAAAWVMLPLRPWSWLHVDPGVRATTWGLHLDRRLDSGLLDGDVIDARSGVIAPRGTVRLWPERALEIDAAWGRGQRPPEIRGIEDGPAPATTADTAEVGAVGRLAPGELRLAGFHTRVANEIVFDPVAARFVATGETLRRGVYGRAVLRPVDPLRLEGELTLVDARYAAGDAPVPFAPPALGVLGAYLDGAVMGPFLVVAGLRAWSLGSRPLPGGFRSTPATVADATVRATWRDLSLDVDLDNVAGSRWRDGEFVFPSWWDRDTVARALPERHISAGAPRALRVAIGWRHL